jgi:hypothetical protein
MTMRRRMRMRIAGQSRHSLDATPLAVLPDGHQLAPPESGQIKVNQGKKSEDDDEEEDDPPSSNFGAAREDCPETLNYETNPIFPQKSQ